jgi:acetaldehyde dehydrogenase / alcohol dehydrogenase
MAICDANLVDSMPKRLTAYGGLDALVHAMESYVSVCATDYTKGALGGGGGVGGVRLCWF